MPKTDPYADPDAQPEATLQAMKPRLEERGNHPEFVRMIRNYGAALPADQPLKVLDLGCGTGVVLRQLADMLHPHSELHGADVSRHLLDEASRLLTDSRIPIQWDHVSPGALPYADASFDVITMHTLVSHVPDPLAVLMENARILKPGGTLIVFDVDHAATTYGLPDYAAMRNADFLLSSAIAANADICRQLPRLLKEAGYQLQHHKSDIVSECGRGDYWLSSVKAFSRLIPALGILPADEGQAWVDHMLKSHEDGTFFAAGCFYTFYATRQVA